MKALLVPPKEVVTIWPEIEPLINKSFTNSTEDIEASDFLIPILQGVAFLWVGSKDEQDIDAVLLAEPKKHPRQTSLFIHAWSTKSGHEGEDFYTFFEEIENFGRINGCNFIEAKVRKGLAKKLNWTNKHSLVTKNL